MTLLRRLIILQALFVITVSNSRARGTEPYKDPSRAIEERVIDLMSRMTLEEKVGQLLCLQGWNMYDRKGGYVSISAEFAEELSKNHIGMLWATLRADPWTQKTLSNGLDPRLAAEAVNAIQKYAIENTRLGIPLFIAEECPHGHMAIGTTVFPTSIGQASTWNPELIETMAKSISSEASAQGVHIGYGPVLDLAREPRWSRMEETYGEDPVLIARMGEAVVRGFQGDNPVAGKNVISTLKHFVGYGNPEGGHNGGHSNIGRRDLMQNYMYPFSAAVKSGTGSVMSAYNSIDGIPCTSNEQLFNGILRSEWDFEGFTVSDLGAIGGLRGVHRTATDMTDAAIQAISAGIDVDLGGNAYQLLVKAVKEGRIEESVIDRSVERVLSAKFRMGLFENPFADPGIAETVVNDDSNRELAREIARQSVILLKNAGEVLPLSREISRLAVIGPNADNFYNQLGDYTAPQEKGKIITVLEGINAKLPKAEIEYVKGCGIRDTIHTEIDKAVEAARKADVAIVVLGGSSARDFRTDYLDTGAAVVTHSIDNPALGDMDSGEGFDRATLELLGKQQELLEAVAATGTPVVLVLVQGRPLDISWASDNIPAIINAWYPGEQGGYAIADVLFGDYNPAGRLPVSYPRSEGQLPVYYNYPKPARHDYVEMSSSPLYPFGFGLSYTSFEYSGMSVDETTAGFNISFHIENTGKVAGDEVCQLYLRQEYSSVVTPVRRLLSFQRISLGEGEKRRVAFSLTHEDMAIYGKDMLLKTEAGKYRVMIGASSEDIRLNTDIFLQP